MRKLNGIMKFGLFIVFVVLLASCKKEDDPNAAYTPQREANMIKEWLAFVKTEKVQLDSTATGIYYIADTVKVGSGPTVKAGDEVTVKYVGMFLDGTIFDASAYHNATDGTYEYVHKTDRMVQGWEEGIEILKKGGSAIFLLPSSKAYGIRGYDLIPPYTPLIFSIEVVDIK